MNINWKLIKNCKKGWILVVKMLIFIVFIVFAGFLCFKYSEYKLVDYRVNDYLHEHNYEKDVLSKKIKYDSTTGDYYMRVYYKKYPERTYDYFVLNNAILGIAYEHGNQIDTYEFLENTK